MAKQKLRKMLGAAGSPWILSLMKAIETQSKATIAKWCMDYCEEHILPIFERHCPNEHDTTEQQASRAIKLF